MPSRSTAISVVVLPTATRSSVAVSVTRPCSSTGTWTVTHRVLGAGRRFVHELPEHVHLRLLEAVPAPGVTHLRYEVVRRSIPQSPRPRHAGDRENSGRAPSRAL